MLIVCLFHLWWNVFLYVLFFSTVDIIRSYFWQSPKNLRISLLSGFKFVLHISNILNQFEILIRLSTISVNLSNFYSNISYECTHGIEFNTWVLLTVCIFFWNIQHIKTKTCIYYIDAFKLCWHISMWTIIKKMFTYLNFKTACILVYYIYSKKCGMYLLKNL